MKKNKKKFKKTFTAKPDWGNPFHSQKSGYSNKIIGGKRGFSGASRKGMGGK